MVPSGGAVSAVACPSAIGAGKGSGAEIFSTGNTSEEALAARPVLSKSRREILFFNVFSSVPTDQNSLEEPQKSVREGFCRRPCVAEMLQPRLEAIEVEVYHRSGEERQHLADDQASDDGDAKRPAKFRTGPSTDGKGHSSQ